jgi:predicted GNAT family N-acyltransferase
VIRPITAAEARPLRHAVLRPGEPAEQIVFPGDDDPRAWHLGAFRDGRLVGIASIYVEPMPDVLDAAPTDWRLRGMATAAEVRGAGLGGELLAACIEHVRDAGGTRLWCNARTPAAGFYKRYRFTTHGEEFDIPGIGPHYRMSRIIDPRE